MRSRVSRTSVAVVMLVSSALVMGVPTSAQATPFTTITSTGPVTQIALGDELSCQVKFEDEEDLQFYPPVEMPGDCGTFIAIDGTLYGPDFTDRSTATGSLGDVTPFTPESQSVVTGDGTGTSPFSVTTVVRAADTGIQITQVDSYVTGRSSYLTAMTLANLGSAPVSAIVYRAGDCFLGGSDYGYGFVQPIGSSSAVGCSKTAHNDPADRVEQWVPITAGSRYYQAHYSDVWEKIGMHTSFDDTCACADQIDNGAGVSWEMTLPPGASTTLSLLTNFGLFAAATTMTAHPAVAEIAPDTTLYFPSLSATLIGLGDQPVVGASIDFFAGSALVCSAETDVDGRAACADVLAEVPALLAGGFVALFSGDEFFLASADDAPLLTVAGTQLP